jgi:hypothetical protein
MIDDKVGEKRKKYSVKRRKMKKWCFRSQVKKLFQRKDGHQLDQMLLTYT